MVDAPVPLVMKRRIMVQTHDGNNAQEKIKSRRSA
jgi:hypothetical protein